jgi:hypothetical protein
MTTTNCQWCQSKLEAFFAEELNPGDLGVFRTHLTSCEDCNRQVQELNGIDPAVREVFQRRLATARAAAQWNTRPRVRRLALAGSTIAVAAVLGIGVLTNREPSPTPKMVDHQPAVTEQAPTAVVEAPKEKPSQAVDPKLTKPEEGTPTPPAPQPQLDQRPADGPDFAIIDANGQSNTRDAYRGRVLLFGVISSDQKEAVTNLQELYQSFGANPKVRILGIPDHRDDKIEGTTFPIWYNHASKLMGVQNGQFLLMDSAGTSKLKGSLSNTADVTRARAELGQLSK